MLISIITPTYNSKSFVNETYQSILNQTYSNWEWIVTDDCSTDDTHDLLVELAKLDSRVKVFANEWNSGAAVSRNNSISHAKGSYLAFIDSDDIWMPNKLESQLLFMGDSIDFSFTAYELISEDAQSLNKYIDNKESAYFTYDDMLKKKATLGCSTVMLRRESFKEVKMPDIRTGQDYALWLQLLKEGHNAFLHNQVLTQYRIVPNSISRNKFKKAKRQWSIYRDIEQLPMHYALYCFVYYAIRAVLR